MCDQPISQRVRAADGSRFLMYREINPDLTVHEVYTSRKSLPDYLRIPFTRMRTSSHKLKIETGRWSRTVRDRRLCECGVIQDEQHVLVQCPLTAPLRAQYPEPVTFPAILKDVATPQRCKYIKDVLDVFN